MRRETWPALLSTTPELMQHVITAAAAHKEVTAVVPANLKGSFALGSTRSLTSVCSRMIIAATFHTVLLIPVVVSFRT
jgi:hypothetical protein